MRTTFIFVAFMTFAGLMFAEETQPALPEFSLTAAEKIDPALALDGWLTELAKSDRFSGSVAVLHDGEILFRKAYGLANRAHQIPNRPTTRFDIGSITKDFTKIVIGRLWMSGKLTPDDTIAMHLADYPNLDVAGRVTIRQLLNHTSGIPDIFNERFFASAKRLYRSPRDYFPLFADRPLDFEPGTSERYSNSGYEILGAIIEKASGISYLENVRQHVFEPAGMQGSGFLPRDEPHPDVAMGYTRVGRNGLLEIHANIFDLPVQGSPAGGSFSSLDDMIAFDRSLRAFTLLPPTYTFWLLGGPEPKNESSEGDKTMPMSLDMLGVVQAGGAPGVNAAYCLEGKLTVIVLANLDPPIAETLGDILSAELGR